MTFVTQSVSTNEHFTWAWPKWDDLWPILPKSTFLKTYPIPIGHDTKTVIYLNYIFRFGLGLRWVISFSVSCFSLFYDLFISRWSDSSQIFWFFRARSIYRKIWMERKLLSIDRTTKWLTSSMTHSVEFIFSCVSRGMNKKVWSSGTVYQVHRDPHTKTDPIGTTGTESPETRWTGRPTMSRESQVETNAILFTNDL